MELPFPVNPLAEVEHAFVTIPVPPTVPGRSALPVENPTQSFWTHSTPDANPLAKEGSTADLPDSVDVCIIGSGITGVGAAYHLSKLVREAQQVSNVRAVILEARDFCSAATGRNGGHLTSSGFHGFHGLADLFGKSEAVKALRMEDRCVSDIVSIIKEHGWEDDVDLVHGGNVHLHFADEEWDYTRRDWEEARDAGLEVENVEWLSAEETLERYGAKFRSTRADGRNVYPLKLVTRLYQLAKQFKSAASSRSVWNPFSWWSRSEKADPFSLDLYTHAPVLSISPSDKADRWKVHTSRGTIDCSYVIHATNAYVSHLLPQLTGPSGVVPTRGQVLSIRASTEKLWTTAWSKNEGFEYWFPRPVKPADADQHPLIILGGGRESAGPSYEFYNADDGSVNPIVSKTLRSFLPAVFPGQFEEGKEAEMEWTGVMGFTQSNEPIIGQVLDKQGAPLIGQYLSVGYSGHGMPRAFSCAEAVAQMVHARITKNAWTVPEWLPAHYLAGFPKPSGLMH